MWTICTNNTSFKKTPAPRQQKPRASRRLGKALRKGCLRMCLHVSPAVPRATASMPLISSLVVDPLQ